MTEEWATIPAWPGYEASSMGRVRNRHGHILRQGVGTRGYAQAELYNGSGRKRKALVHRLVASAFIKNPTALPQVNHIDGVKLNNCTENLEWVTPHQNGLHACRTGLNPGNGMDRAVLQIDTSTDSVIRIWPNMRTAEKSLGISKGGISAVLRGTVITHDRKSGVKQRLTAGGFGWRTSDELSISELEKKLDMAPGTLRVKKD